jgi:DNA-binding SARP family transcriptional activator
MRFEVLGTVAVDSGEGPEPVRWPMPRSVLAALLLNANRVVPAQRLIDVVWGETPPASALPSLQNHVMRLRALLAGGGSSQIKTVGPGYLIEVADGELDLHEFTRRAQRGQRALAGDDWETAARELTSALELWRGEPLADVTSALLREQEVPRLEQLEMAALEARNEAALRLDRGGELIAELRRLTAAHPLCERFHGQLMTAYYQAGRQAEALSAYQRARAILAEELGMEPGPELERLHRQVLAGNPDCLADGGDRRVALIRPAQLAADLGDFTGRAEQVSVLSELARSAGKRPGVVPVCVLTGPGGIGKTSLAIHAGHTVRDCFPDGQLFVRLGGSGPRPAEPGQVLSRFLRDLGADPAQIPVGVTARAAQFRSILAGRRVLIVLDDARDGAQIAPLLPGVAGCAVIVTSRNPLADAPAARRLQLASLASDQAIELLSKIIGSGRLRAEAPAAARVAELCAGLPLALRIAGSRLAARPHWRIEDLAGRLAGAAARLDELAVGDLSVRASFAVSYANLPAKAEPFPPARAFRLLGLWEGADTGVPAAAALFGVAVPVAEQALETLLDSHLLQPGCWAGRYRFHDLLGVYAAERSRAEESEAAVGAATGRMLAWYLHSTVAAHQALAPGTRPVPLGALPDGLEPARPAGPHEAVVWLKDELANLHAAVRMASARGDHETTWKLAMALCTFHLRQCLWADWIAAETLGLASARAIGDRHGEAWLLSGMAVAHWQTGNVGEAMDMLAESLRIRRAINDQYGIVATLTNLGCLLHDLGRETEALRTLEEALGINLSYEEPHAMLAEILIGLGQTQHALGNHYQARASLGQALAVGRSYGNWEWEAAALRSLADIASTTGRHAEAAQLYEQAIAVFHRAGHRYHEITALIDSGHAFVRSAEPARAQQRWRQARSITEQTGDMRAITIDALLAGAALAVRG